MRKSIAIDIDYTVADTLSRYIDWYHRDFGILISKDKVRGGKLYDIVDKEHRGDVKNFPDHPDFFADLPVFPGAIKTIKQLAEDYDIFFATAAMEHPNSFSAKYDWLKTHFPFVSNMNYIFCGFKGILNCDYLIDDTPRHLDAFKGKGLLFEAQHNVNCEGYERVSSWQEVPAKLGR